MQLFLTFYFSILIAICDGRRHLDHCFAYVNQSMMLISIERMNILNSEYHFDIRLPCNTFKGAFTQREAIIDGKNLPGRVWGLPYVWLSASTALSDEVCFNFQYIFYRSQQRSNNTLINIPLDHINHDEAAEKYPVLKNYIMPWHKVIPHRVWSPTIESHICYMMDVGLVPDEQFFCKPNRSNIPIPRSQYVDEMDEDSLEQFVEAMDDLIDHDLVSQHHRMSETEAHAFFFGHRHYLECIKQRLALRGTALPIWSPEMSIPLLLQGVKRSPQACLSSVGCESGWFDLPFYTISTDLLTIPDSLKADQLCSHFAGDFQKLYTETFRYHGIIHTIIGGSFNHRDASATPLLYVFHNWIDVEIFARWEVCP